MQQTTSIHIEDGTTFLPPVFPPGQLNEVQVPGGVLAVEDSGTPPPGESGPAVFETFLCVPGAGDMRQSFRFLAPLLRARGHRVLVMDLRGHGASSAAFPSYTPEDVVEDMLRVLEDRAPEERAVVVAVGVAGAAALALAGAHPLRVKAVVGLSAMPFKETHEALLGPLTGALQLVSSWGLAAWLSLFDGSFQRSPMDHLEYKNALRQSLSDRARFRAFLSLARARRNMVWKRAGAMHRPVCLLYGNVDPHFSDPEDTARKVLAGLPHAQPQTFAIMLGLGHYIHVEEPEKVLVTILGFLEDVKMGTVGIHHTVLSDEE